MSNGGPASPVWIVPSEELLRNGGTIPVQGGAAIPFTFDGSLEPGQVPQWNGSAFVGAAFTWDFNFTADGDGYIRANEAMTVTLGGTIGTGTLAYAKSTAGAPSTFNATTLPATLEAGAFLKVTVSGLSGFVALQIVRTT